MSGFSRTLQSRIRVAVCQLLVVAEKEVNIRNCEREITKAIELNTATAPVDLVILPEVWNSTYAASSFPKNAEVIPGTGEEWTEEHSPSVRMLCSQARSHNVWIVGGSIPEKEVDRETGQVRVFNTCPIISSTGELVAKHRKMHLFDIDIPGKMTFRESETLSAGDQATVVSTPWGNMGVGICYDIRFTELALLMRQRGCNFLVYPGAFNMVTGPAHWELLQRARAVDNQLYVAACSPARNTEGGGYVAWGHSAITSPWGEVIAKAAEGQEIIYADIDFSEVDRIRQSIPISFQKRHDIYNLVEMTY